MLRAQRSVGGTLLSFSQNQSKLKAAHAEFLKMFGRSTWGSKWSMFFSKGGGGGYLSLCPSPLDSFFDICQGVISMIYGVLFLLSKNLLPRSIPSICQDITSSGARTAFSGCQPVIILSSEGFEKPGSDLSSNIWKTNNGQQWSNNVKTHLPNIV